MKQKFLKSVAVVALVAFGVPAMAQETAMNHDQHMAAGGGMGQMGAMGRPGQGNGQMMQMMAQMMHMMMQMQAGQMGDMGQIGNMGDMGQIGNMGDMGQMGDMGNGMQMDGMGQTSTSPATEPGQGAFAAIGEIVAALEADPNTDWSKVDIGTLREHLRDMDQVILEAEATSTAIPGGLRFDVTGEGRVIEAIQRMVVGHARVMQGAGGWSYEAEATDTGATLAVQVPDGDMAKLKALGFFGILTSGMHHQQHHWMMATGGSMDM